MKNNIIIAGVPRAGKSTVSNMLSRKLGYQHISMDSINAGFEKVFPQLGIDTSANMSSMDILHNISGKIAPFIAAMLDSAEYDEFEPGMVLDVYQLLPEDYMKHLAGRNCEVFYFVTSDVTPEERFAILRAHDTEKDYTFFRPEEELRENCGHIVEQSKLMKEQCVKYKLPYFETAKGREKVFERFFRLFAGNPSTVLGISHITLIVKDLELAASFFEKIFGAKEVYSSGEKTFSLSKEKFFLVNDLWICIMEGGALAARGYNHIAFQIPASEFDNYLARIKDIGAEFKPGRPRLAGEGRSIYFYNFDNHLFELTTGNLSERLACYSNFT